MKPLSSRLPDLTLVFVVLFTVAYFLLTHEGLYDLDDYFYSRYAPSWPPAPSGCCPTRRGCCTTR